MPCEIHEKDNADDDDDENNADPKSRARALNEHRT